MVWGQVIIYHGIRAIVLNLSSVFIIHLPFHLNILCVGRTSSIKRKFEPTREEEY
jgi:hypothetical protein